ncbi:hypothetical protein HSISS2_449 [Streptococcus sp. HSISS2]|uniref:hypothetical protein n=1 Tax=Streptococcus sp. HSISS2 TaxID=1316411 RepID=UPI00038AB281|nr:hypothetical protein HSISS2_449 [Streptococcus sp. HSISS2]
MKQTEKQVVFYSAKKDGFLKSYKDKGSIVFEAVFDDCLWKALQLPIEFYEKQKTISTSSLKRLTVKCLS